MQFLGLASYYRKFIPGFAKVAYPLHALTKKDSQFHWTVDCQCAFEKVQNLLIQPPRLGFAQQGIRIGVALACSVLDL